MDETRKQKKEHCGKRLLYSEIFRIAGVKIEIQANYFDTVVKCCIIFLQSCECYDNLWYIGQSSFLNFYRFLIGAVHNASPL